MTRVIRSSLPGGQVVRTIYLACDLCGRHRAPRVLEDPGELTLVRAILQVEARVRGRWTSRTAVDEGGGPARRDVCRECRGAGRMARPRRPPCGGVD